MPVLIILFLSKLALGLVRALSQMEKFVEEMMVQLAISDISARIKWSTVCLWEQELFGSNSSGPAISLKAIEVARIHQVLSYGFELWRDGGNFFGAGLCIRD